MQAFLLMVEINRPYLLWWRYAGPSSYGGDKQPVLLMAVIGYLLWWRYAGCSSYGGDKQTVPVMVEIHRLYFLMILIMAAVTRCPDGCRLSVR